MAYFDRFDICDAFYMFATLYHGGQWSKEYRIFGRLHNVKYRPAPSLDVETLTENGRDIYDALVARAGFPPDETPNLNDDGECRKCGAMHTGGLCP